MQNNKIEHLLMLKTAMSSSAEGIIIVDCFSCPVFINSTGHKLIRHKLSLTLPLKQQVELLGLSHPDGYKMLFAETPLGRALQGKVVMDELFSFFLPDMKEICLHGSANPIDDGNGKIAGAIYIFRQAGERKTVKDGPREKDQVQARRTLIHQQNRLEAILENIPSGVIIAEASEGLITYVNRRSEEKYGLKPKKDASLSKCWEEINILKPGGDRYLFEELPINRALMCGEDVRNAEIVIEHPDGYYINLYTNAAPIFDEKGKIIEAVMAFNDITEFRQVEEERRQLLEQVERWAAELDIALSSIADGLIIYNIDGRIIRMNCAARRMFGYPDLPLEELHGRTIMSNAYDASGRQLEIDELPAWRALRGETVCNMVMVFGLPETSNIWVSVSAAPLCLADRGIIGSITTFTDITALHDLQQQQEDLLNAVSHDLRNPLSLIQGHAQLMKRTLQEELKSVDTSNMLISASAVINSARRMNVMIQDLVDAARMSAGCMALDFGPVDIQQFIRDLLEQFSGAIDISRIELSLPKSLPQIMADSSRLERIMSNLLNNALKYSGDKVVIEAETYPEKVQISVIDSGLGITEEEMPYIFDRFYRTRAATRTEGLGLGLYITRKLIEAHGGEIWAESHVDKGSTFRFTMPVY
ncbi:MAG: ATP-binding protein [bacterium]|jgi:PAS domain S-box-containing protein|nr:ATP-binding protein [bacterium]MDD4557557.1 ATP-binding protein [bacterium]